MRRIVQAQADELQNFVAQDPGAQLSAQASRNGTMSAPDIGPPAPAAGRATTAAPIFGQWGRRHVQRTQAPTTNDLWLQILSMSLSNATAHLVIHPPWNVTNGVYDLLYCTNLAPPISWQWLLRTDPGQTNLTAVHAASAQGFYRLGSPNDLAATDSLGTNFWLAFFNMWTCNPNACHFTSPVRWAPPGW